MKTFFWLDLEMTGLDVSKDIILEVAAIITDEQLAIIDEFEPTVLCATDSQLASMLPEVKDMHTKSGLIDLCLKSSNTSEQVQEKLLDFLRKNCEKNNVFLAGNSVYNDLIFLKKYMPKVSSYLHYRIIDISTLKELAKSWYGVEYPKKKLHRALDDIKESIEELMFYREKIFK